MSTPMEPMAFAWSTGISIRNRNTPPAPGEWSLPLAH